MSQATSPAGEQGPGDAHATVEGVTRVFPANAGNPPVHALGPIDMVRRRGMEAAELKRLKRENAELKRANAILRSASAFFAAELDRPQR